MNGGLAGSGSCINSSGNCGGGLTINAAGGTGCAGGAAAGGTVGGATLGVGLTAGGRPQRLSRNELKQLDEKELIFELVRRHCK